MWSMVVRLSVRLLPLVGVCVGVALVLFAFEQIWYVSKTVNDQQQLAAILARNKGDEYFNAKIDLYNRRADDTRNLLVYLIAIGGFITTLQGLFAYFSVQNYTKQADEAVKKLSEFRASAEKSELDAQQRLRTIEEKAPLFSQFDAVINKAVDQLLGFFGESDTITERYVTIPPLEREEIRYYERGIAGLEVLEVPAMNQKLADIFRGLSIFYASKFFDEQKKFAAMKAASAGKGFIEPDYFRSKDDLNRAKFYAEIARNKTQHPFCIENDLGWIAAQEGGALEAETHFQASLALHPNQQRASTNLAISFILRGKVDDAIPLLEAAKRCTYWEIQRKDLKSKPCYNLACAFARKAAAESDIPKQDTYLARAYLELVEMMKYDIQGVKESYLDDIRPGGDLAILVTHPVYEARMKSLSASLA